MVPDVLELIRNTGFLAWFILLAALVSAGAAGVFALVAATGRRVPGVLWGLLPAGCVAVGCAATGLGVSHMLAAIAHVDPEQKSIIANVGLSEAIGGLILGFGGAGSVLLLSTAAYLLARLLGKAEDPPAQPAQVVLSAGAMFAFGISALAASWALWGWSRALGAVAYADPAVVAQIAAAGLAEIELRRWTAIGAGVLGAVLALGATGAQVGRRPTTGLVLSAAVGAGLLGVLLGCLGAIAAVCAPAVELAYTPRVELPQE